MKSITERPQLFSEMVGQKTIVNEMKKRSKNIDFSHYMMMVGQSGSGKSTSAFIIAKLLNCYNPVKNNEGEYEPCNKCEACVDVIDQKFRRDVYYLDASTMGKEEVNDLTKKVNVMPFYDKNKIIIIDEAHLLNSPAARGAMLMLTEKERSNVYFILCTTDNSKFDTALNSRFIYYRFTKSKTEDIGSYLLSILDKNKIEVPDDFIIEGLRTISYYSDGSVRQAVQYLERCIYGSIFSMEEILKEFGFIDPKKLYSMLGFLVNKDVRFFDEYNNAPNKENFYHYTKAVVMGIIKYKICPIGFEDWKEKNNKKILENPNFIKIYKNIYGKYMEKSNHYFQPDYFLKCVYDYWIEDDNRKLEETSKHTTKSREKA